jgi:hypothetical protein
MRIFNKIVVVILILVALPVGTLFLVLPDVTAAGLANAFTSLAALVTAFGQAVRMGLLMLALALDLVLLWLLYLELRRKPTPGARVTRIRGGEGEVTVDAVQQRVHHYVSQLTDVVEARADVSAKGGRVRVALDVVTSPHVNIPQKIDEIVQVVREAVTGGMGLKLRGKPTVSVRHIAYGESPAATRILPSSGGDTPPSTGGGEKGFRLKLPGR